MARHPERCKDCYRRPGSLFPCPTCKAMEARLKALADFEEQCVAAEFAALIPDMLPR